jgi:hypothetical protein
VNVEDRIGMKVTSVGQVHVAASDGTIYTFRLPMEKY